jgi:hypothetical protein
MAIALPIVEGNDEVFGGGGSGGGHGSHGSNSLL